jgi:hypothetical protein
MDTWERCFVAKEARTLSSPELVLLAVQELLTCLGGAARSGATAARATSFGDIIDRGGADHVGFATYIAELDVTGLLDSRAQLDAATTRLRAAADEGLIKHSVCANAIGVINELFNLRDSNRANAHRYIHYVGMVGKATRPTSKRWDEERTPHDGTQLFPLSYAFPGSSWTFKVAISDSDFFRIFKLMQALAAVQGRPCLDMFQLVCLSEALVQHYMCSHKRNGAANIMDCGVAICSTSAASPAHMCVIARAKSNLVAQQLAQDPAGPGREQLWRQAGELPLELLLPQSSLLDLADELQLLDGKLPAGRAAPTKEFVSAINRVYGAMGCARLAAGAACLLALGVGWLLHRGLCRRGCCARCCAVAGAVQQARAGLWRCGAGADKDCAPAPP